MYLPISTEYFDCLTQNMIDAFRMKSSKPRIVSNTRPVREPSSSSSKADNKKTEIISEIKNLQDEINKQIHIRRENGFDEVVEPISNRKKPNEEETSNDPYMILVCTHVDDNFS